MHSSPNWICSNPQHNYADTKFSVSQLNKCPKKGNKKNHDGKTETVGNQIFIRPSKTGRIMLSPVVGCVPQSLSGAYLQDYASYGYETSWVDRSHQGGVQCTGTITLACLIFELLPFVYFHT